MDALPEWTRRITLYYDTGMKELDGRGWCLRLGNSSVVFLHRFETLADTQMYITDNSWWFMPSLHEVGNNDNQSL